MNKYSDNLKVRLDPTQDLAQLVAADSQEADMRQTDKAMFVVLVDVWNWGVDTLNISVREHKPDDPPGVHTELFAITGIQVPVPARYHFAVDVKAEDLNLADGNTHALIQTSRTGAGGGQDLVTMALIADDDHHKYDESAGFNEVFDRFHTTPAQGGAPLPPI